MHSVFYKMRFVSSVPYTDTSVYLHTPLVCDVREQLLVRDVFKLPRAQLLEYFEARAV
jgi:hypothetical protein